MTHNGDPREEALLKPVLRLFPKREYRRFREVPLGRKKIDVWCVRKNSEPCEVCVELKVKDWRKGLWQAIINFQIAGHSYIAVWHKYVQRAERETELLRRYGVGLISVGPRRAEVIIPSEDRGKRCWREDRKGLYKNLISV